MYIVDWILAVIILAQEPECHLELFMALWRVRQLYSLGSLVSSVWDPFRGCAPHHFDQCMVNVCLHRSGVAHPLCNGMAMAMHGHGMHAAVLASAPAALHSISTGVVFKFVAVGTKNVLR